MWVWLANVRCLRTLNELLDPRIEQKEVRQLDVYSELRLKEEADRLVTP